MNLTDSWIRDGDVHIREEVGFEVLGPQIFANCRKWMII